MGVGQKLLNSVKWLFGIKDTQITRYPLDEELIKKEQIIKAQQQQLQARDAQLAKISAQDREKREAEKSKDYTQEIAKRAKKREEEIRSKRFNHTFSLRYFLNKCGYETKPTKFGQKVEVTDKDDTVTFGNFGDIVITDNGYLLITDNEGNILNYAKDMTQLIWKPDGLSNYMKRNRIPLAVDEEMNPVPDLEEEEHPDVVYDPEEDEYAETEVRRRPVKEMLIERDEKLRDVFRKLERAEKLNIDKDHKLNAQSRVIRMLENRSNLSQSELSSVLDKAMQFENKVGEMQNQIVKLTELKALHETSLARNENVIEKLLQKLENHGDKTMHEFVKQETKSDIEFYGGILPEKVPVTEVEEKEPNLPSQPGQRIG